MKMMNDSFIAARDVVVAKYYYYTGVAFPEYTEQCSYDIANTTYAMMNIAEESNRWAGYSKYINIQLSMLFTWFVAYTYPLQTGIKVGV